MIFDWSRQALVREFTTGSPVTVARSTGIEKYSCTG